MADSAVETNETIPTPVEKETVTSSIKESPVKETNGKSETPEKAENGTKNGAPKENGAGNGTEEDEETKEEESEVACPIKRKSCSGDAEAPEITTPEKKQKIIEETDPAEEAEEPVEA